MIRLTVAGAAGRMGKTILALALRDSDFEIAGALEHPESPALDQDVGALIGREPVGVQVSHDTERALRDSDVLIDFTQPSATPSHLKWALKTKTSYVLGTAGLKEKNFSSSSQRLQKDRDRPVSQHEHRRQSLIQTCGNSRQGFGRFLRY